MNTETVNKLRELNNRFYAKNAQSFSETRQHAWPGWDRVLAIARENGTAAKVLDIAGGNLRFEEYCMRNGLAQAEFYVVDSCPSLAKSIDGVVFQELDIVELLASAAPITQAILAPQCDLVASFGFAHHIPDEPLRVSFVRQLIDMAESGGIVALTFWQFAEDPAMKSKAMATTEAACNELGLDLDEGDYILGWKDVVGAYRYCHSFSDQEIDHIVHAISETAEAVDVFSNDGKSGRMNRYVVLRRKT